MSSSREIVLDTLNFAAPARIPRQLWLLPWAEIYHPQSVQHLHHHYPDDIITAPAFGVQYTKVRGNAYVIGQYTDEWGCLFENLQAGVIGEVKHPLIDSWDALARLAPPEEAFSLDSDQVNQFCRASDQFVLAGCCPRPFERMQFLRSSTQLYLDLAEESPELIQLRDQVHHFYLRELEIWAKTDVDGMMFMDDWGAQRNLLISPRQWRKLFKPLYKDYIDLAHLYGKKIMMHSDGCTASILPDLIELGLDGINTQIFTMDIDRLGRDFGGKITFWGEIDRQHLLPFGTPQDIEQAVQMVYNAFYRDGGVIAQCEFGAGAQPENVEAVFRSWDQVKGER